jgi:hypothetical protein
MNQTQTDTRPHVLYHCENLILRLGFSIYRQVLHFCEFVGFVGNLICIQQTFSTNIVFANIIKHILNLVRVLPGSTGRLNLVYTAVRSDDTTGYSCVYTVSTVTRVLNLVPRYSSVQLYILVECAQEYRSTVQIYVY